MSTLYRTPNIVIDEFEFHIAVEFRSGRVRRFTRWRPLVNRQTTPWASIATYPGKKRQFACRFAPFKRHIAQAEQSVVENRNISRDLQLKRAARFVERAAA